MFEDNEDLELIKPGDVVQIRPHDPVECYDGCLMIVETVVMGKCSGYFVCPAVKGELPAVTYYTVHEDDCIYIGEAQYELSSDKSETFDAPNLN
jgi:hypothetical protein